jgi:hypothetical protein
MLHDVGKIGIKEEILQKQKKLLPHEIEIISMRLKLMRAQLVFLQQTKKKNYRDGINRIDRAWKQVIEANEPTVLKRATDDLLEDIRSLKVPFDTGEILSALTEGETQKLSITMGSLSEYERLEIESHVSKTFDILKMIPWSKGLEQVPNIAYKHHEKLDGSGYPNQIGAEDIPPQVRMMTICDIYDALRADDRPYKPAVPVEKALDIIAAQVKAGELDGVYFAVFLQAQLYNLSRTPSTISDGFATAWSF